VIVNPYRYSSVAPPAWSTTTAELLFNGADGSTTMTDTTGRVWTASGNAQLDTAQFHEGTSSLLLDGTGDYISTVNTSDIQASGDFRIECRIRPANVTSLRTICAKRSAGTAEYVFTITAAGKLAITAFGGGGASVLAVTGTTTFVVNTWYTVALERVGTLWSLYVNGVLDGSGTESGAVNTGTNALRIGRDDTNTARDFNGHIDVFKFQR
jgi:hypothetical protein